MQVHYCDVCGQLLKDWDDVYVMGICKSNKSTNDRIERQIESRYMSGLHSIEEINEMMQREMQRRAEQLKVYEICGKCKEVFDHFVKLRTKELQKIKESIEKSLEENNESQEI